ncbi:hypothetical protein OFC56_39190, partial [Escherichia coli]|nr:hypothetical protein [Escherichia coli]
CDHGLLAKSICASAIISVNNESSQYRGLIDKKINEFSGNHKVFTNALTRLEYLGMLGRFEKERRINSYSHCAIETFCNNH